MILCLDVGNTQIYGGVFDQDEVRLRFRRQSRGNTSSDEYGVFLRTVLRENDIAPESIEKISICTVVPEVLHSLRNACVKYFDRSPFVLQTGVKTGLRIKYHKPAEVGSDRIANAISATHLFPGRDLLIVDFGTATTFCAVNAQKDYLGGVIIPGVKLSMQALVGNTSKLPAVEIHRMENVLGRTTVESIQSGLYYATRGAIKEIEQSLREECFGGQRPLVIGTGGFASLYENESLFDEVLPDLVLQGLFLALKLNS